MNMDAQFERDLERWLEAVAPATAPAGLHAAVIDRARTMRQNPGWALRLPLRWFGRGRGGGRGMMLFAAGAVLLSGAAVAAAGAGLLRLPWVVPPVPQLPVVVPSPTAPSPAPGAFAYIVSPGYGLGRLWVAGIGGSGAHELLTNQPGIQQSPLWSPDGRRLLFSMTPKIGRAHV